MRIVLRILPTYYYVVGRLRLKLYTATPNRQKTTTTFLKWRNVSPWAWHLFYFAQIKTHEIFTSVWVQKTTHETLNRLGPVCVFFCPVQSSLTAAAKVGWRKSNLHYLFLHRVSSEKSVPHFADRDCIQGWLKKSRCLRVTMYRASLRLIHLYVMIYAIDSEIKTSISPSEMIQSKQTP